MGAKKYSLAGGALSAKMKAGGSKCGIGDALTRELHLPSQWMESGIMPVWQTVRLLRKASLNKHQKILKHFMQHIVFFPVIGYCQIFCHFKTSSYQKNTWTAENLPEISSAVFWAAAAGCLFSLAEKLPDRVSRTILVATGWTWQGSAARLDRRPARQTPVEDQPTSYNTRLLRYIPQNSDGGPQKSLGFPVFLVKYCTVLATSAKTWKLGVYYT